MKTEGQPRCERGRTRLSHDFACGVETLDYNDCMLADAGRKFKHRRTTVVFQS